MTLTRREFFAAGAVASAVAAGGLSACTPADIGNIDLPGRFFAAVSMGQLVQARAWASPDITLSLVSSAGSQRLVGPQDVVKALSQLFAREGFCMIGDTGDGQVGGLYWREMGPWQCSDMLKGGAVTMGGMCSDDHLENSLFNVFVDADFAAEAIKTILLLENRNLIAQLNFDPAQAKFGK